MNKILLKPSDLNPFIRSAGEQHYDQWPHRERRLYDYELIYCFNGSGNFKINGLSYALQPKTLILIPPNIPTLLSINKNLSSEMYWVHFDFICYDNFSQDHIKKYISEYSHILYIKNLPDNHLIRPLVSFEKGIELPYVVNDENGVLGELIRELIKLFNEKNSFWELACKIQMERIILEILGKGSFNEEITISTSVIHYIENNYHKNINLECLANYFSINKDKLMVLFKNETGTTIIKFLMNYRINKAAQLLVYTKQTIKEIAFNTGFNDQYYFSKVFKKQIGESPKAYRKRMIEH